ncbi:trehalose-phosphatase [Alkalilimnicola ehrlichii MLHE-1]|uniref:Trehalose 6-phosphate phosphatase n=1 Tax=Alkalilimnicola ehrlichii (strain ATCC BAA-1101 / DSM 17681 / MLHE-1) TaxID=187272 RepID=Q0ACS3_ALKEH|nr:trehalose-phosphatase [Alkalilimnicola ehrlichii]ABI55364.1 trehalose 6-phosphatase [Alkalilimnicola ehrlichii MLHE-1]
MDSGHKTHLWRRPDLAFFLDLDGTLLPIVPHPDDATLDACGRTVLRELMALSGGAVALVSGRTISAVDRVVEPLRLPVAGVHGAEWRDPAGRYHRPSAPSPRLMTALRDRLRALTAAYPGTFVEEKGIALAVHFRRAPEYQMPIQRALSEIAAGAAGQLTLQAGKCVYELRPADGDKGRAVRHFMAEAPFASRAPVYLGDDLTDEHAFVAVNALGGYSIKVGAGHTEARWRLPDQPAVIDWLRGNRPAAAIRGEHGD